MQKFKAMLVEQKDEKKFERQIIQRSIDDLPNGELLIKVHYSSLNYKDALSAIGNPGVSRNFPHTPGIDAAGEVIECSDGQFSIGEKVIITGYDLGMNTAGGFGQYIRIPSQWALALPEGLSLKQAMIYGTAGFTAALSIQGLIDSGVTPEKGDILVTGASGGVGSMAVALLAKAGFNVVAATGKSSQTQWLTSLGASQIITRAELLENQQKPLLKERWAGVIDCVGGDYLTTALKSTRYGGCVTCCGLTASAELNQLNVFPFILRGITLKGIDSVQCDMTKRQLIWQKLATEWKPAQLETLASECNLTQLDSKIDAILAGQLSGRTVVNLNT